MLKNLIIWEKESGYRPSFVAEKLGLNPSHYSLIKSGKRKPSIKMARKLQEEFKVKNVFELLEDFTDER